MPALDAPTPFHLDIIEVQYASENIALCLEEMIAVQVGPGYPGRSVRAENARKALAGCIAKLHMDLRARIEHKEQ